MPKALGLFCEADRYKVPSVTGTYGEMIRVTKAFKMRALGDGLFYEPDSNLRYRLEYTSKKGAGSLAKVLAYAKDL